MTVRAEDQNCRQKVLKVANLRSGHPLGAKVAVRTGDVRWRRGLVALGGGRVLEPPPPIVWKNGTKKMTPRAAPPQPVRSMCQPCDGGMRTRRIEARETRRGPEETGADNVRWGPQGLDPWVGPRRMWTPREYTLRATAPGEARGRGETGAL